MKLCACHYLSDGLLEYTGGAEVSIKRIGDLLSYDMVALLAVARTR